MKASWFQDFSEILETHWSPDDSFTGDDRFRLSHSFGAIDWCSSWMSASRISEIS
jgi:hypothetical protein